MEERFKPRKALASELGIATRTLERKLKDAHITIPKGLLSPQTQKFIGIYILKISRKMVAKIYSATIFYIKSLISKDRKLNKMLNFRITVFVLIKAIVPQFSIAK